MTSPKVALRQELRRRVNARPAPQLGDRLLQLPELATARVVHLFMPLPNEPDLRPVAEAIVARGGLVLVPDEHNGEPIARRWTGATVSGKRAPTADGPVDTTPPELILVPGLGFDAAGCRVGRGGGHYDRVLQQNPAALAIGLCGDDQRVDCVPVDPWDRPVHMVLTPTATLRIPPPVAVVGAIWVKRGRLLVARRRLGGLDGDRWELPGGKVDFGESLEGAVCRELREELNVDVSCGAFVGTGVATRPERTIVLSAFAVHGSEEPTPHEHSALAWCAPETLRDLDWAAADRPLLALLEQATAAGT